MNPKTLIISLIVFQFSIPFPADAQIVLDPVVNPPLFKTEIIQPDIGLSSPFIQCIYEDKFGFLWIGSQYGLDLYDGFSVTRMSDIQYEDKTISMEWIWFIYEDLEETLWVCSSRGLFRYDRSKNSFDMFLPNPDNPISFDNQVLMSRQDSRGIHWVFTRGGLFSYDPVEESFTDYKKDSIIGPEIYWNWFILMDYNRTRYLEDSSGNIWICTSRGLKRYDPANDSFISYQYDPEDTQSISGNLTFYVMEDKYGNLWLISKSESSGDHELIRILDSETGIFKRYACEPPDPRNTTINWMYGIYHDRDSNLWVGGHNGFFRFDYQTDSLISYYLPGKEYPDGRIWGFLEGPEGYLWMLGDGLISYNHGSGKVYQYKYDETDKNNILPGTISSQPVYKSRNLWLMSSTLISRSESLIKPFNTLMSEDFSAVSRDDRTVSTVCNDSKGNLWFGGDFGLYKSIDYYPGGKNEITSVTDQRAYCLMLGSDEQLWIGSYSNGLGKLNEKTQNIKWYGYHDHPDSLNSPYICEMFLDSRGLFWVIPHRKGINIFSKDHERFISLFEDYENTDDVFAFYATEEDRHGDMWFGSFVHGLTRIDISEGLVDSIDMVFKKEIGVNELQLSIQNYRSAHLDKMSLASDQVMDLHIDKSGRLWIGTTNGLNLYNEKDNNFYSFTTDDGLPDNCIIGILEDDHGNLWMSSRKGIFKIVLEKGIGSDIIKSVNSYRKEDGLQGDIFYEKSRHRSNDGWMSFGGSWGLTFFHPDSIRENQNVPPVYITDIFINEHSVYAEDNLLLDDGLFETEEIRLPYRKNSLAFEYVVLNYSNSEQNQYRYKMEGLDEEWVEAGTRKFAEYRDLKPGSYIFCVLGSNDDGVWNEEGASMGIVIHPPWYRSIIAYLVYLILLSAVIYAYIQWRTWKLRQERDELEAVVKERTSTIQDQNKSILNANTQLEERKEELEQQTEELQQQKEELQNTLDRLKETQDQLIQSEKLAALGGLVAGVAHEINTPVGISVTAASNLAEETKVMAEKYKTNKISKADFKDFLSTANQSAKLILANMERTAEMVQSFKLVSADQTTGERRRVVLRSYLEDIIRSLYPRLKGRRISIDLDVDPNLEIDSYPGAISQIFTNLILNSVVHGFDGKEKGDISIEADIEEEYLHIKYRDSGHGIQKETINKIFEPFFTTNKKAGTGLGLHIVYNMVTQKLNGSVTCDSKPGEGVEFNIIIPV